MLAKKFALGFGIAVILPMLVHYGVSTFSPRPKWRDYYNSAYYQRTRDASPEEKAKLEQERKKRDDEYHNAQKRFQQHLFFVAVPVGMATIVIGSISSIQAIGTGLMLGGIFTLIDGYCWYWSELQDWMRFLSLLAAFVVLIFIGYRKLAK
jgi:hypothetical protein